MSLCTFSEITNQHGDDIVQKRADQAGLTFLRQSIGEECWLTGLLEPFFPVQDTLV